MAVYPQQAGEPAPELTLTQYITFIVIKFQALPTFPPMVTGLPLGSDTKENLGETVKHAELEDKSPHFLYTD